MRSRTTARFRKALAALPRDVQNQARQAYGQFIRDPWHRSLRYKQVHSTLPIYSARVGAGYRAVGRQTDGEVLWFWIGTHNDYEKLLAQL